MWNPFNRNTISNSSASKRSLQLITQKGMPFAYVEAYKALRTNLTFLPAGTTPPNPSELLSQPQMQEMVDTLRGSYDFVILDAPPISMVTDAAVIGRIVDGALFVVRSKYASTDAVKTSLEKLQDAGVKVLGAVLTRYDAKKSLKRSDYGYGYYYYNSNYSYGTPPDGISESAAEKSCLTSKNRHNGKEKHSVHTEDET